MSDTSIYFSDEAPEYLRKIISLKAQECGDGELEHPYLKPGAPRWMVDRLREIEKQGYELRGKCLADYQKKPATWLIQMDGFNDKCMIENKTKPEPDYWLSCSYQLANAPWNARLYIAPDTTRKEALTLAAGFSEWLERMSDADFVRYMTPPGTPRILADVTDRQKDHVDYNDLPF